MEVEPDEAHGLIINVVVHAFEVLANTLLILLFIDEIHQKAVLVAHFDILVVLLR